MNEDIIYVILSCIFYIILFIVLEKLGKRRNKDGNGREKEKIKKGINGSSKTRRKINA